MKLTVWVFLFRFVLFFNQAIPFFLTLSVCFCYPFKSSKTLCCNVKGKQTTSSNSNAADGIIFSLLKSELCIKITIQIKLQEYQCDHGFIIIVSGCGKKLDNCAKTRCYAHIWCIIKVKEISFWPTKNK